MAATPVVWRVIVYTSGDDATELFRAHSGAGLTNPYLNPPRISGRRIDIPEGRGKPGQARVTLLDKRTTAGDQTTRWLTTLLGDADGRHALRTSRMEIDVSEDGGQTFMREFTGRIRRVTRISKNEFSIDVDDPRVDERDDIFDGTDPLETVDWATPPILLPVGIPTDFKYGAHPPVGLCEGKLVRTFPRGPYFASAYIEPQELGVRYRSTAALREHASYTGGTTSSGLGSLAPDIRAAFKPTGEQTFRKLSVATQAPNFVFGSESGDNTFVVESVPLGVEGALLARRVGVVSDVDDDSMPADGTTGTYYLYSAAPPTDTAPLHIGVGTSNSGVAWPVLVSGIAVGAFGGGGFDVDHSRLHELAQDETQPKMRFRITEGPESADTWLEANLWPVIGFAPAVTNSGALYPVSYDLPSTTAGMVTLDSSVIIAGTWDHSRTGEVNHVRFNTDQERTIKAAAHSDEMATDAIEEFEGDRIITAVDSGRRRKPFTVDVKGIRLFADTKEIPEGRRYLERRSDTILDIFRDGPQEARAVLRRTDTTKNLRVGDHVILEIPYNPNLETNVRGGSRIAFTVSKSPLQDGTYDCEFLDMGPSAFADAPSIDAIALNEDNPEHVIELTVTPPGNPQRAHVQFAVTASGVATPEESSGLWKTGLSIRGDTQLKAHMATLPSRRRVHFRARGEGPGRLPSSWVVQSGIHTKAITPPSNVLITVSGATMITQWTVGDSRYPTMIDVDGADWLDTPLQPNSSRFIVTNLAESTEYFIGVRHVDQFGGDSTRATNSGTTQTGSLLVPPEDGIIIQGVEGGINQTFQGEDLGFGSGIEIGWRNSEPFAITDVLHSEGTSGGDLLEPITTLSGVEGNRLIIPFPLDDVRRWFQLRHRRDGFTPSALSPVDSLQFSAKPTSLVSDSSNLPEITQVYFDFTVGTSGVIVTGVGNQYTHRIYGSTGGGQELGVTSSAVFDFIIPGARGTIEHDINHGFNQYWAVELRPYRADMVGGHPVTIYKLNPEAV